MERVSKIYFFDLDDTLVNMSEFMKFALDRCFDFIIENGVEISKEKLYCHYNEIYEEIKTDMNIMEKFLVYLFSLNLYRFNGNYMDLVREVSKFYSDLYGREFNKFMPKKVVESLKLLKEKNCLLGVISQGSIELQKKKFDALNVFEFFEKDLLFFTENKSLNYYKKVFVEVKKKYEGELFMVGDRESIDVLIPRNAGFVPIRIVGNTKYLDKNEDNYIEFKDFKAFYESIKLME